MRAASVVVATGAYQRPHRPAAAEGLPSDLLQLDAAGYRNPAALPPGRVLIVGSGQSGCQIAEELREAGREVFLACGRVPWAPRRIGDRDVFWWIVESGFADAPLSSLPSPMARLGGNATATGNRGGRDLNLRTLRARGVTLLGHFAGVAGRRARFAPDLAASVAWGDERYTQLTALFRKTALERGLPEPLFAEPEPFDAGAPEELDLAGFGAVIFASGFRPDYSWIDLPGAFDELGFPIHVDGESTIAPGAHFVGVHFLRKRKSSLLIGVGEDAALVARRIAERALS
jgi:putative flavoprotein involved in K+ transport